MAEAVPPGFSATLGTPPVVERSPVFRVLAAEAKLSKRLGAPVKIKVGKTGGVIEIKFSSPNDLARVFDLIVQARH